MTLQEAFSQVKDHRQGPAVRHDLKEMIVMAICGVLCGCDDWVDIADWCKEEEVWLKTRPLAPVCDTHTDRRALLVCGYPWLK